LSPSSGKINFTSGFLFLLFLSMVRAVYSFSHSLFLSFEFYITLYHPLTCFLLLIIILLSSPKSYYLFHFLVVTSIFGLCLILWHTDQFLGKDSKISDYTTTVAR
jgi:hypothetical protein